MSRAAVAALLLTTVASVAEASPRTGRDSGRWPASLVASFDGAVGPMTWGHVEFEEPFVGLQMSGTALRVERVTLYGGSVGVAYVGELFTGGVRLTYGTSLPGGGEARVAALGATVDRMHVFSWAAETGVARRFGDLTLYAVAHAAWTRALVEISHPSLVLRGRRPSVGPKLGIRAHVRGNLFLHAALFMDALAFPDHRVTIGLGVGQR